MNEEERREMLRALRKAELKLAERSMEMCLYLEDLLAGCTGDTEEAGEILAEYVSPGERSEEE